MNKNIEEIESSKTYQIRGSVITYQQMKNGTIKAIRGKAGKKEIFKITQKNLKEIGLSGLIGISQRYGIDSLVGKAVYGLSQLLKQKQDGTYILK